MLYLATYLQTVQDIHNTGAAVPETSYYSALERLLSAVGSTLSPTVRCIPHPANMGAGIPDFGLFTHTQFRRGEAAPVAGQMPARGIIEAKGTHAEAEVIAQTEQVGRYLDFYGSVLVTNLRDFLLLTRAPTGGIAHRELFRLAPDEAGFWALVPHDAEEDQGERFTAFLRRVMAHGATLTTPETVAWFLADYAREARLRIEGVELPALRDVRRALEGALGVTFRDEQGDHFFRSTLIQTLTYGIFAAWVLWSRHHAPDDPTHFSWREAAWDLRVPTIRAIFERVAVPTHLNRLQLVEVLNWIGDTLNRVDRRAFFQRFDAGSAVQYFYEPFLAQFDPELREALGVWYTPIEVVRYQVARVDQVLREELGRPAGLADDNVFVLDPCCGTGAYIVEVLRHIHETLQADGDDLGGDDVKRAAMRRVIGFELLPAPYVVAHLQVGLLLDSLGSPLDVEGEGEGEERAAVYLTNALTGWEEGGANQPLAIPGLEAERELASSVKRDTPVLVVLGNPPYNGFAGLAVAEERELTDAYRTTVNAPEPQGHGLNDLYVRFFRMAERRIIERTGEGVVCFISNFGWLDGLSFTGMRERYATVFDRIWIDNLNGDRFRTGKRTPDGLPDPSVFSSDFNREGIQVGTAIALMVRRAARPDTDRAIQYREFWGVNKRAALLAARNGVANIPAYEPLDPPLALGLPFAPLRAAASYLTWPLLPQLFPVSYPGIKTSRDDVVVDVDRDRLVARMERYFNPAVSHEEIARMVPGAMESTNRFNAAQVRDTLRQRGILRDNFVRFDYRPFDVRWLYWEPETKLLDEKRAEYVPHILRDNLWLAAARQNRKPFDPPPVTSRHGCLHLLERSANLFPLKLKTAAPANLFEEDGEGDHTRYNLSGDAAMYLARLTAVASETGAGTEAAAGLEATPEDLYFHIVAILHAAAYRTDNDGALRQDWPRIPLPATADALAASATLGRKVVALLDMITPVPGVSDRPYRCELAVIAPVRREGGGGLNVAGGDLAVTVRWGHRNPSGAIMPGTGRVDERAYDEQERAALSDDALALLGNATQNVRLNDRVVWANVPTRVWQYMMGGYPVLKKWLSYRQRDVLGRDLRQEEAREFTSIARRIAALLLLGPELDANYIAIGQAAHVWPPEEITEESAPGAAIE